MQEWVDESPPHRRHSVPHRQFRLCRGQAAVGFGDSVGRLVRGDPLRSVGGRVVSTLLIVITILILLGAVPAWPYSREWGFGPLAFVVVLLLLFLFLRGHA